MKKIVWQLSSTIVLLTPLSVVIACNSKDANLSEDQQAVTAAIEALSNQTTTEDLSVITDATTYAIHKAKVESKITTTATGITLTFTFQNATAQVITVTVTATKNGKTAAKDVTVTGTTATAVNADQTAVNAVIEALSNQTTTEDLSVITDATTYATHKAKVESKITTTATGINLTFTFKSATAQVIIVTVTATKNGKTATKDVTVTGTAAVNADQTAVNAAIEALSNQTTTEDLSVITDATTYATHKAKVESKITTTATGITLTFTFKNATAQVITVKVTATKNGKTATKDVTVTGTEFTGTPDEYDVNQALDSLNDVTSAFDISTIATQTLWNGYTTILTKGLPKSINGVAISYAWKGTIGQEITLEVTASKNGSTDKKTIKLIGTTPDEDQKVLNDFVKTLTNKTTQEDLSIIKSDELLQANKSLIDAVLTSGDPDITLSFIWYRTSSQQVTVLVNAHKAGKSSNIFKDVKVTGNVWS